jgi:hypothetical protein
MPLVFSDQGCPGAFGDGLLGQILLAGRHWIGLDHGVVVVIKIEQIGGNTHADRITFTAITVNFYSHGDLLTTCARTGLRARSHRIRPHLTDTSPTPAWILRLERVTTR